MSKFRNSNVANKKCVELVRSILDGHVDEMLTTYDRVVEKYDAHFENEIVDIWVRPKDGSYTVFVRYINGFKPDYLSEQYSTKDNIHMYDHGKNFDKRVAPSIKRHLKNVVREVLLYKMDEKTKYMFLNSEDEYLSLSDAEKKEKLLYIKEKLKDNVKAESIGFPLEKSKVEGAKAFLKLYE